jgi:hypothetical protein
MAPVPRHRVSAADRRAYAMFNASPHCIWEPMKRLGVAAEWCERRQRFPRFLRFGGFGVFTCAAQAGRGVCRGSVHVGRCCCKVGPVPYGTVLEFDSASVHQAAPLIFGCDIVQARVP